MSIGGADVADQSGDVECGGVVRGNVVGVKKAGDSTRGETSATGVEGGS